MLIHSQNYKVSSKKKILDDDYYNMNIVDTTGYIANSLLISSMLTTNTLMPQPIKSVEIDEDKQVFRVDRYTDIDDIASFVPKARSITRDFQEKNLKAKAEVS